MDQVAPMEVGLSVIDAVLMHEFYTEVLGCVELRRADIPAGLSDRLTLADDGYLCIWLKTPNGEVIKLMNPLRSPDRTDRSGHLTASTGFAFLTFYVNDLAGVLATAEAHGAELRSDRALTVASGTKLCFFADPEGNVIELVEKVG